MEIEKPAEYFLLVLAAENEQRPNDMLQQIIETNCSPENNITAFVLSVHQFNKWIMQNHPFACKVYHNAQLCYDAGRVPLAIPGDCDVTFIQQKLQLTFNQSLKLAAEFVSGAELFALRMQYPLAAFHLHQSAEQLYTGIIYSITGLKVQIHNLDKLYRYSRYLVQGLAAIFPRDTEREKCLFKLLQSSYIQSRYSINYRITPIEFTVLNNRVVKLLQLCQAIKNSMPFYI